MKLALLIICLIAAATCQRGNLRVMQAGSVADCQRATIKAWHSISLTQMSAFSMNPYLYNAYYRKASEDYSTALKICGVLGSAKAQDDFNALLKYSNPVSAWDWWVSKKPEYKDAPKPKDQ